MNQLKELNKEEKVQVGGGTFAYDIGWLIGSSIANYNNPGGWGYSAAMYYLHYN